MIKIEPFDHYSHQKIIENKAFCVRNDVLCIIKEDKEMQMFDPAHPGELIRELLNGLQEETGKKFTVEQVANGLGTTRKTLSAIINCRQSVSPEMVLRLSKAFNTTAEFWLHAQENYDLAQARKKIDMRQVTVFWEPKVA